MFSEGVPFGIREGDLRREGQAMNTLLLKLYIKLDDLASREDGQDLVEYALLCAMLCFGWVASVRSIATALNSAFGQVSTSLGSYVT
jgi:pilus assembly protein Flp/PilA